MYNLLFLDTTRQRTRLRRKITSAKKELKDAVETYNIIATETDPVKVEDVELGVFLWQPEAASGQGTCL